ncbi:hypothetical protein GLOIN_2v1481681 [Rhizophagus clarus]|uniref:Uncharacterized protein n=1 Tax=Rhizophagus clarus TaxID=94130 RepID=A0A8H3MC61_9GLOM|nr:hypothetical protein GLOIN_2v1481681 [Rhizophagus clarus]
MSSINNVLSPTDSNVLLSKFKKKALDFPITVRNWAVKEMLINTIQRKRYYLNKKKIAMASRSPQEVQKEAEEI